jgi:hypothetical protein
MEGGFRSGWMGWMAVVRRAGKARKLQFNPSEIIDEARNRKARHHK